MAEQLRQREIAGIIEIRVAGSSLIATGQIASIRRIRSEEEATAGLLHQMHPF